MNPVTGLSLGRIGVGALAVADPDLAAKTFQLDASANPQLSYLTRLFGAREVALGLATVMSSGKTRRNLILLGILVDASDVATGYLGVREGAVTRKTAGTLIGPALGAVAAGVAGLRRS